MHSGEMFRTEEFTANCPGLSINPESTSGRVVEVVEKACTAHTDQQPLTVSWQLAGANKIGVHCIRPRLLDF